MNIAYQRVLQPVLDTKYFLECSGKGGRSFRTYNTNENDEKEEKFENEAQRHKVAECGQSFAGSAQGHIVGSYRES